jgi:integrase
MWTALKREMNIEMGCEVVRNAVLPPFAVAADLVPYCLRHTYATDLQAAGVPINVAKTFLGHEDISTTGNIYTHDSKASFEDARAKIDAFKNIPCATPCASAPANH